MQESLFSPLWYRVAEQHPRLRPEVRVQRQLVRDQRWYLLVNAANGRQYRINHKAYEFMGRCDGGRSVQQVWDDLLEQLRDEAPTQAEVVQTLNQLDEHDLIAYETAPDAQTMVRRRDEKSKRRMQNFVNPFALRIPLGNPSALLKRVDTLPPLLFNRWTLWIWIAAMVMAGLAVGTNWNALVSHATAYMSTPRYLLLAWVSFPVIKGLHELGHALALRRWGGTAHEIGFSLFVLVPAPYVDASAAAAFPRRYQRVIVGAAGIMVELAIAAIALAVWMTAQPGIVRDFAFVTMFIASVSTVMFNGNPLLAFDAYYVLCDTLDLPNLGPRSKAWWTNAALRAFGSEPARVHFSRGEGKWLYFYAPLSLAYRIILCCLLILWLGSHSSILGALAVLFLSAALIVKPAASIAARMWAASTSGIRGWGPASVAATVGTGLVAALCAVPVPFHTVASGVVWPPEHSRVRAATDGFITQVLARDGDAVTAGQVLVVLDDPALPAERDKLTNRLEQLHAGRFNTFLSNSEQSRNVEEEIGRVEGELRRIVEKIGQLEVRAQASGRLVMPHQQDLPGTLARRGSTVGYVLERADIGIRAAIPEYEAALVRDATRSVEVRVTGDGRSVPAELVRHIPAATYDLPSAALGDRGGGSYPTDPADSEGLRARDPVVLIDLNVPSNELERIGSRAWVRFDHGAQPLAGRWYRQLRQVFLQHFNPAG